MIIGITGKIGSGKSTLAIGLKQMGFVEYSFADPLKKIGEIFGFSHDQLYGTQENKLEIHETWNVSSRTFLQKVGTELFREQLPLILPEMKLENSIWIELFKMKFRKEPKSYVISDVRFKNEAEAIRKLGGIIIKTVRNEKREDAHNLHKSEKEIDEIEYNLLVDNDLNTKEQSIKIVERYLRGISVI